MGWRKAILALGACWLAAGAARGADEAPAEDDWSLPSWVQASPHSGFFSESADTAAGVDTRVVDLTWRQLQPAQGSFSTTTRDKVYDMDFGSWDEQLSLPGPFWLRLWISGRDWAPAWVQQECQVQPVGVGYEGDPHLPIWNACLWSHALALYREVLLERGLRSDPRLQLVYVPGAFTYCEFDFDIVNAAVEAGLLSFETFDEWFRGAITGLVSVMNGENADPSDDLAYKLVYTGEDYPFGPWDTRDDLYARDAVVAGMGIRTGITELFNFHLSHVPAYGALVAQDGHVVTDESWPLLQDPRRVVATENECYNACGFHTDTPYYAVKMSNLKALHLRVNWLYVVPSDSYLAQYPELWRWVRLSLGKTVADAPDAWVALREAEDRYWKDDDSHSWSGKPYVRNLERWLVQRDVAPDAVSRRGSELRKNVLGTDNGTAYEGRATDLGSGTSRLAFDVDDRWLHARSVPVQARVTYLDTGAGSWSLIYTAAGGPKTSAPVPRMNTGRWRTAVIELPEANFDDTLSGSTDFQILSAGPSDLELRFVRVVKLQQPDAAGSGGPGATLLALCAIVALRRGLARVLPGPGA